MKMDKDEDESGKKKNYSSKWKLLSKALLGKGNLSREGNNKVLEERGYEKDRFPNYGLFDYHREKEEDPFLTLSLPEYPNIPHLKVTLTSNKLSAAELMGFNNTGNIRIWPSSECLTRFCLENPDLLKDKRVLELGGGMLSPVGLLTGLYCRPSSVYLSDGNSNSVENIERVLDLNDLNRTFYRSHLVRWDREETYLNLIKEGEKFQVLLISDCLFFEEGRPQLVQAIDKLLLSPTTQDGDKGIALIMAPPRGQSFNLFHDLLISQNYREKFKVEILKDYSSKITSFRKSLENNPKYDSNLHYPHLIKVTKIS